MSRLSSNARSASESDLSTAHSSRHANLPRARYSRGFKTRYVTVPADTNVNAENSEVISASLAAGLYPKVLSIDASGGMKTLINQQPVAIVCLSLAY